MDYNNDFKYDLKIGQVKEEELGNIFLNKKVEVKKCTDAIYNVFVEYESRGKKSGISTSEADYYCFAFKDTFLIISTEALKVKCRKYIGTEMDKLGGDNNTSKGILLPIKELCKNQ
tara:strand:- start:6482 stop:6829 length:348 start_codon:yes stop_codon:yes gene_type:complete